MAIVGLKKGNKSKPKCYPLSVYSRHPESDDTPEEEGSQVKATFCCCQSVKEEQLGTGLFLLVRKFSRAQSHTSVFTIRLSK